MNRVEELKNALRQVLESTVTDGLDCVHARLTLEQVTEIQRLVDIGSFLGNEVRDKVTGFTGICTARTDYLFCATTYAVVPRLKPDGNLPDAQWFEEGRLELVEKGKL